MRYGFIGAGNMGGAIARGLSKSTKSILLSDRSGRAAVLAEELGVAYGDNETIARECQVVFLGVKPHMMKDVLHPLRQILAERKPLLISMAAGLTLQTIETYVGASLPMIRIMTETMKKTGLLKPEAKVYLTHMARTLHGTQKEVEATAGEPFVVCFDGMEAAV
jgi:pyrroline-5-carboxylate reductase